MPHAFFGDSPFVIRNVTYSLHAGGTRPTLSHSCTVAACVVDAFPVEVLGGATALFDPAYPVGGRGYGGGFS